MQMHKSVLIPQNNFFNLSKPHYSRIKNPKLKKNEQENKTEVTSFVKKTRDKSPKRNPGKNVGYKLKYPTVWNPQLRQSLSAEMLVA